jgi:dephospho-CoA kinase
MNEADALARIASQADDASRRAVGDLFVPNDADLAALERAVDETWAEVARRAASAPSRITKGP